MHAPTRPRSRRPLVVALIATMTAAGILPNPCRSNRPRGDEMAVCRGRWARGVVVRGADLAGGAGDDDRSLAGRHPDRRVVGRLLRTGAPPSCIGRSSGTFSNEAGRPGVLMTRDLVELGRLGDENLAGSWAAFGAASGAVGSTDRCTLVATGIPAAFFNGAYLAGPVDDPEQVVADAIAFMAERGVPWLLWVRAGVDDAVLDAGRRAGLRDAGGPPGMVLPSIGSGPPAPDGLEVRVVRDLADVAVFRDVAARGFEMPAEIGEVLVPDSLVDDPAIGMVIGWNGDAPVSCALVSITGSTAGIYNVATPPEFRRRGYGAAVTWTAIEEGARRGCDHSILQASEMGAPVYRAMGFVDIGRYVQLEGPPQD